MVALSIEIRSILGVVGVSSCLYLLVFIKLKTKVTDQMFEKNQYTADTYFPFPKKCIMLYLSFRYSDHEMRDTDNRNIKKCNIM